MAFASTGSRVLLVAIVHIALCEVMNKNPLSPPHLKAHMFLFGNGQVNVTEGTNPLANNALDGSNFLRREMGFNSTEIEEQKQVSLTLL